MTKAALFRRCAIALLCAASAAPLLSSCSIFPSEPFKDTRYYDLGFPDAAGAMSEVDVVPFSTDAACKFKMLYRTAGNEMLIDEYNKWTQPPGQMLTKYLRIAFRREFTENAKQAAERRRFQLSGSILAFEADLDAKEVRLGVRYHLAEESGGNPGLTRTKIFCEPLKTEGPEAVSLAMSKAATQFIGALREDLASLEKAKPGQATQGK